MSRRERGHIANNFRYKSYYGSPQSLIDEIKAQDIYTLHNPDKYPGLPSETLEYNAFPNSEPVLSKTSQWGSVVKKLSPYQINTLAVLEEENSRVTAVLLPPGLGFSDGQNERLRSDMTENVTLDYGQNERLRSDMTENVTLDYGQNERRANFVTSKTVGKSDHTAKVQHLIFSEQFNNDTPPSTNETLMKFVVDDNSWVDLSRQTESSNHSNMPLSPTSPDRVTPLPFGNGEEYLRLLREAQKESNQSSAKVSLASSKRDTPRDSPKSPPNSPNTEVVVQTEETPLKGVYINYYNREGDFVRVEKNVETDWIWDWSSRPDQAPPKEWKFVHPGKGARRGASIRRLMVGNSSLFSRDVLYTLLITNVLSLLLGTGIGVWLSKRTGGGGAVTLSTVSIN